MATVTIGTPLHTTTGSSYAANVSRAARALLAALFAVKPREAEKVRKPIKDISICLRRPLIRCW